MKKVYLSLLSIIAAGASFAQLNSESKVYELASPDQIVNSRPILVAADRTPDQVHWQDDFSTPANWSAAGPSGDFSLNGWTIGTTTNGWYFPSSGDMGTSGNFARFVNGTPPSQTNPNPSDPVIENGPFILEYVGTPIDLTSVPAPHLEFEQYGARFLTLQAVEVSTDGGTNWTEVGNNNDIAPLTSTGGAVYAKPETRRFNITSAIVGNPANVTVRFVWDGAQNGSNMNYIDYGWFVDNVRVVEGHPYDAEILTATFASGVELLPYYKIPTTQVTGIEFSAEVRNQGSAVFDGLHLEATVDMGGNVFSGTSASVNVPVGATDSMVTTTMFTPSSGVGTYDFEWVFVGDNPDTYNANDVLTDAIQVTDYTYSRDNGVQTGSIGQISSQSSSHGPMGIGNLMEFFADGVIGAIDLKMGPAEVGNIVYVRIDKWNGTAWDFVAQGDDYNITASNINNWIKLVFATPVPVANGDVLLITTNHYGGDPEPEFAYAQETIEQTVVGYTESGSLFSLISPNAIMIRADMRDFSEITENENLNFSVGQNVPNPFDNNSVINYTLEEAAPVSIEFTDLSGKLVRTINQGSQAAGSYKINVNANDFAEGVYFYTFTIGEQKITKRMVVTK